MPEVSTFSWTCVFCRRERPVGSTFYEVVVGGLSYLADPDCTHFNLDRRMLPTAKVAAPPSVPPVGGRL